MTGLLPTSKNIRSELARHRIRRRTICEIIGMHPNLMSAYTTGHKPIPDWAAHNIGYAINAWTEQQIFDVEMERGVLPAVRAPRQSPVYGQFSLRLPARRRRILKRRSEERGQDRKEA
jgi:hypothetical protein